MAESRTITISEIGVKARSKKEVYMVLTVEGGLYLPPMEDASQVYLKQILTGKKKYILCKNLKVLKAPHVKKLRVNDILSFASNYVDINSYIPEYNYKKDPQREWLCNIVNTLINNEFKQFIANALRDREKLIVMKKNLKTNVLPEFAEIFCKSNNVSVSNGRSHFLFRDIKRKRNYAEMSVDSTPIEEAKKEIDLLYKKVEVQELELRKHKEIQDDLLKDKEKLCKLYESGYIDSDGEPKYEVDN